MAAASWGSARRASPVPADEDDEDDEDDEEEDKEDDEDDAIGASVFCLLTPSCMIKSSAPVLSPSLSPSAPQRSMTSSPPSSRPRWRLRDCRPPTLTILSLSSASSSDDDDDDDDEDDDDEDDTSAATGAAAARRPCRCVLASPFSASSRMASATSAFLRPTPLGVASPCGMGENMGGVGGMGKRAAPRTLRRPSSRA